MLGTTGKCLRCVVKRQSHIWLITYQCSHHFVLFCFSGYVTDKSNLPVTVMVFPPSTSPHSKITVGPLECFGTLTNYSNAREETVNIRQQAARFLYTLCNVVNLSTPHPPRAAPVAPDRKPDVWQFPYTSVPKKETPMAPTTLQRLSGTKKPTIARSPSHSKDASPVGESAPFPSSSEVPGTATDSSICDLVFEGQSTDAPRFFNF